MVAGELPWGGGAQKDPERPGIRARGGPQLREVYRARGGPQLGEVLTPGEVHS